MMYAICLLAFVLGALAGAGIAVKIFGLMVNQGSLVFKADGHKWIGNPEAFQEIARQMVMTR